MGDTVKGSAMQDMMSPDVLRPLLALTREKPLSVAVGITSDKETVLLLHKTFKPKKVMTLMAETIKKASATLDKTTARFGVAHVDDDEDSKTLRIRINKDAPEKLSVALTKVVKRFSMEKVVFFVDPKLEEEAEEPQSSGAQDVAGKQAAGPAPVSAVAALQALIARLPAAGSPGADRLGELKALAKLAGAAIKANDGAAANKAMDGLRDMLDALGVPALGAGTARQPAGSGVSNVTGADRTGPIKVAGLTPVQSTPIKVAGLTPVQAGPLGAGLATTTPQITAEIYFDALAKVAPELKILDAEASSAKPRPLLVAAMHGLDYLATCDKLAAAEAAKDYDTALKRLRTKAAKAVRLQATLDYLNDPSGDDAREQIRKAELCLATSGGSTFKTARIPFDAARATQAAAEMGQDYAAATAARKEAAKWALPISQTQERAFQAKLMGPVVARALALIAADNEGAIPDARRTTLETMATALETCVDTSDYSNWFDDALNDLPIVAKSFIGDFSGQSPDAFFKEGMKSKPTGIRKLLGRKQSHPQAQGSDNPLLRSLSEKEKMAAIDTAVKRKVRSFDFERDVKATFKKVVVAGLGWEITPVELAALYAYTTDAYKEMNGHLRDQAGSTVKAAKPDTEILNAIATEALAKLPPYDPTGFPLFRFETVYGTFLVDRYTPGTTFTIPEFWSTGAGRGAVFGDDADAEIVVWGKKASAGKTIGPISAFPKEGNRDFPLKGQGAGEVLFPPGSSFKTVSRDDLGVGGGLVKMRGVKNLRYRIEVMEV